MAAAIFEIELQHDDKAACIKDGIMVEMAWHVARVVALSAFLTRQGKKMRPARSIVEM